MKIRRTTWLYDGDEAGDHVAVVHLTYNEVVDLAAALEHLNHDWFPTTLSRALDELRLEVDGK